VAFSFGSNVGYFHDFKFFSQTTEG